MIDLLIFILVSYGLTQILVYGKIFDFIRPKRGKLGELFSCTMCVGWWVGAFLYVVSPYIDLFSFGGISLASAIHIGSVEYSIYGLVSMVLVGCLSSGTSYMLDKLIGDEGININENK